MRDLEEIKENMRDVIIHIMAIEGSVDSVRNLAERVIALDENDVKCDDSAFERALFESGELSMRAPAVDEKLYELEEGITYDVLNALTES